jgi:hypothetical protein
LKVIELRSKLTTNLESALVIKAIEEITSLRTVAVRAWFAFGGWGWPSANPFRGRVTREKFEVRVNSGFGGLHPTAAVVQGTVCPAGSGAEITLISSPTFLYVVGAVGMFVLGLVWLPLVVFGIGKAPALVPLIAIIFPPLATMYSIDKVDYLATRHIRNAIRKHGGEVQERGGDRHWIWVRKDRPK